MHGNLQHDCRELTLRFQINGGKVPAFNIAQGTLVATAMQFVREERARISAGRTATPELIRVR